MHYGMAKAQRGIEIGKSSANWKNMAEVRSAHGVGNLHFIQGNVEQYQYIDLSKKNLKENAINMGIRDTLKLYQDNDPKHKSWYARVWALYIIVLRYLKLLWCKQYFIFRYYLIYYVQMKFMIARFA